MLLCKIQDRQKNALNLGDYKSQILTKQSWQYLIMSEQHLDSSSIVKIFQATFSSTNNAAIKEAEGILQNASNNLQFSNILFEIISKDYSKQVKNAASVYLKKLSHKYSKDAMLENINRLLEVCWIISIGQHPIPIKKQAVDSIQIIIKQRSDPYLMQILQVINTEITTLPNKFDLFKLQGIAMIARKIFGLESESLIKVSLGLLSIITDLYQQALNSVNLVIGSDNDTIVARNLQCLIQINNLIKKHLTIGNFMKNAQYLALFSKQNVAKNLWRALNFPVPQNYKSCINQSQSFHLYNNLKSSIIDIITKIIVKLQFINSQHGATLSIDIVGSNPLYIQILSQTGVFNFVSQMVTEFQVQNLPKSITTCIQKALRLLTVLLHDPKFQNYFSSNKSIFIYQVAIPLMKLGPRRKQDFVLDPEEFINYLNHSMPSQYSITVSTQEQQDMVLAGYACQFLKAYCMYQHGSLVQIFTACSEKLVNGSDADQELSLIVMASLLHQVVNRKDLMDVLNIFVVNNIQQYNTLQKNKYIKVLKIYLGYKYLVKFAVDYSDTVLLLLKLSLSILSGQVHSNDCLEILSVQIIRDLLNYGNIMNSKFEDVLEVLCSLINKNSHPKILQLIHQIVQQFFVEQPFSNDKLVLSIVHQLVLRIYKQNSAQIINNQVSNRCWNIIRTIGDNPKFIPSLTPQIQAQISRLYPFLKDISKIQFQEDIILMLQSFVYHSKSVTKQQFFLLEYFKPIFLKNSNRMGELFIPMNYIITYGATWFVTNPQTILYVVEICESAISIPISEKVGEVQHLQGIVTLQSLIISCGDHFSAQTIGKIMIILYNRLNQQSKLMQLEQNLINGLALLFCKAVKLVKDPSIELILTKVLSNPPKSGKSNYIIKSYVIALCEMLRNPDIGTINNRYANILDIVLDALQFLSETKSKIDNDQQISQDQYEYNLLIQKQLINNITLVDQFKVFQETIQVLNQSHGQLLKKAIESIPKEKRQYLRSLHSIINVDDKPRQIVKVKRN